MFSETRIEHTISRQTDFQTNAILFYLFIQKRLLHTTGRTFTPDHWAARKEKYGEMLRGNAYICIGEGM
jgi:hypothetical protein